MLLPPHLTIFLATGGGSAGNRGSAPQLKPTENYKPMWATVKPPSEQEIKDMEQKLEALNAKNDGWVYHLNMDSGRNFTCFGLRNKPKTWLERLINFFK